MNDLCENLETTPDLGNSIMRGAADLPVPGVLTSLCIGGKFGSRRHRVVGGFR